MVDLMRRYSNRVDLLARLREACVIVGEQDSPDRPDPALTVPVRPVEPWRVRDRVADSDVQVLIADYLAGMSARALAERYDLSVSALKVLLKRHGVRRTP
jgi:hypothetical protein